MSQENVEIVRRFFDALGRRDIPTMDELSHQQARFSVRLGEVRGRPYGYGELASYFADLDEVWDQVHQTATDLDPIDDARVVLTVRWQGRARSSGVEVDQLLGVIVSLRDGKLVRVDAYQGRREALDALRLPD